MKFKATVKDSRGEWNEFYDVKEAIDEETATAYMNMLIENFNATLRTGERPRTLVEVTLDTDKGIRKHRWTKTNLVSQMQGSLTFDLYRCTECGITGKRYGLSWSIKRDDEFRAKGYEDCIQAKVLLAKRNQRRTSKKRDM